MGTTQTWLGKDKRVAMSTPRPGSSSYRMSLVALVNTLQLKQSSGTTVVQANDPPTSWQQPWPSLLPWPLVPCHDHPQLLCSAVCPSSSGRTSWHSLVWQVVDSLTSKQALEVLHELKPSHRTCSSEAVARLDLGRRAVLQD